MKKDKLQKIILIQAYQLSTAGDTLEVPRGVASELIKRGVAQKEVTINKKKGIRKDKK